MRLGVNIDHVATLRQARMEDYPEPVYAALIAQEAGADQITIHLREDRRHINERDVRMIKEVINIPLNIEMALSQEIIDIACDIKPERITLVPEKREEVTTEGGLDIMKNELSIRSALETFSELGIELALFIDPDKEQIDKANELGINMIELHTGSYANSKLNTQIIELSKIKDAAKYAHSLNIETFAGHGLTYQNVMKIADIEEITELNIGHNIISKAVFVGLENAILEMKAIIT
jgi:pyridoxine 5-phosphate synthase